MYKYQVLINGRNFLIQLDGKPKKLGFFKTVCVESESLDKAELAAVEIIKSDKELTEITLNKEDDVPMIYMEEIVEVESFDDLPKGETGRAFYVEKKWWQFWK